METNLEKALVNAILNKEQRAEIPGVVVTWKDKKSGRREVKIWVKESENVSFIVSRNNSDLSEWKLDVWDLYYGNPIYNMDDLSNEAISLVEEYINVFEVVGL